MCKLEWQLEVVHYGKVHKWLGGAVSGSKREVWQGEKN